MKNNIFVLILLIVGQVSAQVTFEKRYRSYNNANNYAGDARQTSDGGYIISGGAGPALLMKISSIGDVSWSNFYSCLGNSSVSINITQLPDGGYIFNHY